MADDPDVPALIHSLLTEMDDVYARTVEVIRSAPATRETFTAAGDIGTHLRKVADDAADLRAEVASRIYKAESLSLAALGNRIGVSKARAQQLTEKSEDRTAEDRSEGEKP